MEIFRNLNEFVGDLLQKLGGRDCFQFKSAGTHHGIAIKLLCP